MSIPQPIFEVISAPELPIWNHAALIEWLREWERDVEKMRHHYPTSGETYENVDAIVIMRAVQSCCSTLKNEFVPDVTSLFRKKLKMDLSIDYCEARVLRYYNGFNVVVENSGLHELVGADNMTGNDSCKSSATIQRVSKDIATKTDSKAAKPRRKSQKTGNLEPARSTPSTVQTFTPARTPRSSRPKPQDGCLHCKGSHWLTECPTATAALGEEAQRKYRGAKERRASAVCSKAAKYSGSGRTVRINGLMETPDLLDTEPTREWCPTKQL
ncbi:LOW QUALITY PROTEIN: hypothetical protein PHMEG_00029382 [Phytophthora megakarya]|uniref:Uncharacterized protein n=1 Tax=Phytophthora megakarya TaxID=4795 RepID=A0A225V2T5_9STRA|nr:LOW QUALITY PROTEIN: hypothetical protein PHMEG_00029382 [Phytophthora megakarya]